METTFMNFAVGQGQVVRLPFDVRCNLESRAVFRVKLWVPPTMTLYERVLHWFNEHWLADVALVVPDHEVTIDLRACKEECIIVCGINKR